jgi:NAD(P)-dependent dehydrogenase (short-subunit alcohol dehydrogenase family)
MSSLNGKSAIVTGGSRGIGFAIAQALLARGASVIITATGPSSIAKALDELGAGGRASMVHGEPADVRNAADIDRLVAASAAKFGGLDILVNNAGVGVFAPVADMTTQQWNDVIETNVTGVFNCCHAAIPHLRTRGGGWIINISSLAGTNPFVNGAAYCASKAAVDAFSEALMQEVRHDGIRVAHIAPGSVDTNFAGHASSGADWKLAPDDVAEVVVDLISHPARSLPSRVELRPARPPKKG